jgi:hypothetical protein
MEGFLFSGENAIAASVKVGSILPLAAQRFNVRSGPFE